MENNRESFIFYRSFYEAIKNLPKKNQVEIYGAIAEFSLNFRETNLNGISKTVFTLIKPQLEANIKRYESGKKGGRPPKENQNETETQKTETKPKPNDNQNETKAEANVNDNDNDNDNVNGTDNDNVNVNENENENEVQERGKKTPPPDFVNELILMFKELYFRYRKIEYIDSVEDRKAVGLLLSKYRKRNKGKNTEECRLDFEAFFKQCLNIRDSWYWTNMSLSTINSKINQIRTMLSGGNSGRKQGITDEEFEQLTKSF